MSTAMEAFRSMLQSPAELWQYWLENCDVVDPNDAGVVVATGRPETDRLAEAKRAADAWGWKGLLDEYWTFLASYDGVAIDHGGGGEPRVAVVAPEELIEPLIWPARSADPDFLSTLDRRFSKETYCFGELYQSGRLFFRKARSGIFGKARAEVWFVDVKGEALPVRVADSFGELLTALVGARLQLPDLLASLETPA